MISEEKIYKSMSDMSDCWTLLVFLPDRSPELSHQYIYIIPLAGAFLLTWINFSPSMDM